MAGNVVSNVKKYYGGQVPVPGQGDSDGKVKVLVEKTATMEIGGVQTEVELLFDSDDLTTPVTPQQLGQWTDENYLIAFKKREDDGRVRGFVLYALETDSTSTDTLVNRAEFIAFKEDMTGDPGASAYEFTMVEDSSTLTRYLRDENGEMVVKFNKSSVEAGAQSGTLHELIDTDTSAIYFEVVHEDGKSYLRLNTEGLVGMLDDMLADIGYIIGALDELPSDEHGYFNSSLYTTPGDGTTTNLPMDDFRISEGRDVSGENIEFVPTRQEGGVDFGNVYLEPGTYILAIQYTLQWVGNPRGTFLPKVCSVADQPFDFSYEHEDVIRVTRIVTRTTRGKLVTSIPIDADTPPMGVWVKNMEVVQVTSYSHPPVYHDTTLTGTGQTDSPLGITPTAFGKIYDIPTSISQFRTGDVVPVAGPNGPAKIANDDLLAVAAQNAFEYAKIQSYFATRQALADETSRATQRENEIEALFVAPTEEAVAAWLEAHPEATTTVQDGSLTEQKFSNTLKSQTIKDYVTPEMFGAVGDGVTDDTDAFKAMISASNKYLLTKTYVVSEIVIDKTFAMIGTPGNSIIALSNAQEFILRLDNGNKNRIVGVHFNGGGGLTPDARGNVAGVLLNASSTSELLIERCTFNFCKTGLFAPKTFWHSRVSLCRFNSCRTGISIGYSTSPANQTYLELLFSQIYCNQCDLHVYLEFGSLITFSDCSFGSENVLEGSNFFANRYPCRNVVFRSCNFEGIYVKNNSGAFDITSVFYGIFENCVFHVIRPVQDVSPSNVSLFICRLTAGNSVTFTRCRFESISVDYFLNCPTGTAQNYVLDYATLSSIGSTFPRKFDAKNVFDSSTHSFRVSDIPIVSSAPTTHPWSNYLSIYFRGVVVHVNKSSASYMWNGSAWVKLVYVPEPASDANTYTLKNVAGTLTWVQDT